MNLLNNNNNKEIESLLLSIRKNAIVNFSWLDHLVIIIIIFASFEFESLKMNSGRIFMIIITIPSFSLSSHYKPQLV